MPFKDLTHAISSYFAKTTSIDDAFSKPSKIKKYYYSIKASSLLSELEHKSSFKSFSLDKACALDLSIDGVAGLYSPLSALRLLSKNHSCNQSFDVFKDNLIQYYNSYLISHDECPFVLKELS
jgi:hypothetical protein